MKRKFLAVLVVGVPLAALSCLDDAGPEPFTTAGTCFVGETKECNCDGEPVGVRSCTSEARFGPCNCPGCTVFPDCSRCEPADCFENCMCHSERRVPASVCESTCANLGDAGADGGDAGEAGGPDAAPPDSGGTGTCVPELCPPAPITLVMPCCAGDSCGVGFMGTCIASGQPGELDPNCPDVMIPLGTTPFSLPGCCRPDGFCGALENTFLQLGCVDTAMLTGTPSQPCTPQIQ